MNYADYFKLPGISMSELRGPVEGSDEALTFGTLFDNLVLTPNEIDYANYQVEGRNYTQEQMDRAQTMLLSLQGSEWWNLITEAGKQVIYDKLMEINYGGIRFLIHGKCKYDMDFNPDMGGDLKSTDAKSKSQFEAAIEHFGYDAQRAWYMDISGKSRDVIIGVSKHYPYRVFVVPISRTSEIYQRGRAKYEELAFSHFCKFGSNV